MTKTLFLFLAFVFILFVALSVRIYMLNRDHGDAYKKQVFAQQSYTNKVLKYRRGAIKDRNDTILAQSVRRFRLVLEPKTMLADDEVKKETVAQLVQYFQADASALDKLINDNPNSMYQYVEGYGELTKEQVSGFEERMKAVSYTHLRAHET